MRRLLAAAAALAAASAATLAVAGDGAGARTCKATSPDALGPFYVRGAPVRSRVGTGHVLTGVVRSTRGCRPLARARIEFWLANPQGEYDAAHRATLFSRRNGSYRFESNFPPRYGSRPPHIHIRVTKRGFRTLVTQYYPREGSKVQILAGILIVRGRFDLVLKPR